MVSIMVQAPVNAESQKTRSHGRLLTAAKKVPGF
jgi:hypothetical protein